MLAPLSSDRDRGLLGASHPDAARHGDATRQARQASNLRSRCRSSPTFHVTRWCRRTAFAPHECWSARPELADRLIADQSSRTWFCPCDGHWGAGHSWTPAARRRSRCRLFRDRARSYGRGCCAAATLGRGRNRWRLRDLSRTRARRAELPAAANPLTFAIGFVIATGLLHLAGIACSLLTRWRAGILAVRLGGVAICLIGFGFLVG